MGLQEYLVTKKNHSIEEFVEAFGRNIVCITTPKKDIAGIDDEVTSISMGTDLIVLYGDRYDLRDLLNEKFSDETFWGSETVNEAAIGTLSPTKEQIKEMFNDRGINEPAPGKWRLQITYSWGDDEPDQTFLTRDDAWEKAKLMAANEAETASEEHECEIGLSFNKEEGTICLRYTYDNSYCTYNIVEEGAEDEKC